MVITQDKQEVLRQFLIEETTLPSQVGLSLLGTMSDQFIDCHEMTDLQQIATTCASHFQRGESLSTALFSVKCKLHLMSNSSLWAILLSFHDRERDEQLNKKDIVSLLQEEFPHLFFIPHLFLSLFMEAHSYSCCYFIVSSPERQLTKSLQKQFENQFQCLVSGRLYQKQEHVVSDFEEESLTKKLLHSLENKISSHTPFTEVTVSFYQKQGDILTYRIAIAWVIQEGKTTDDLFLQLKQSLFQCVSINQFRSNNSVQEESEIGTLDFIVKLPVQKCCQARGNDEIEKGYDFVHVLLKDALGSHGNYKAINDHFRFNCYQQFLEKLIVKKSYKNRPVNSTLAKRFFYSIMSLHYFSSLQNEIVMLFLIYQYLFQMQEKNNACYCFVKEKESHAFVLGIITAHSSFVTTLQSKIAILLQRKYRDKPHFIAIDHKGHSFLGILFFNVAFFSRAAMQIERLFREWARQQQAKQILRLNLIDPSDNIHPALGENNGSDILGNLLFEGLMYINKEGKLEKALAEKIEVSEDKKRYVFTLKPAEWSDGTPITNQDWVHSWKEALLLPSCRFHLASMDVIKNAAAFRRKQLPFSAVGIKAKGERQLVVELEWSLPYFLQLLTYPSYFVFSQKKGESHPFWHYHGQSASSGPFRLINKVDHPTLQLLKNPHYWNASAIPCEKILISKQQCSEKAYHAFREGNIDLLQHAASFDLFQKPEKKDQLLFSSIPHLFTCSFNITCPPFRQIKIRQALGYSLNRNQLISELPSQYQFEPWYSLIPSTPMKEIQLSYSERQRLWKEGMEVLGLRCDTSISCRMGYYKNNVCAEQVARQLKTMWEEQFALKITLCPIALDHIHNDNNALDLSFFVTSYYCEILSPLATLENFLYKEGRLNITRWEDPFYRDLVSHVRHAKTTREYDEFCYQAMRLLMKELPAIPLFRYFSPSLVSSSLKKSHCCALRHFLRFASLQLEDSL